MDCQIRGAPLGTQMLAPKNECRGRDEKTIPTRDGNRKAFIYYLSVDQIDIYHQGPPKKFDIS